MAKTENRRTERPATPPAEFSASVWLLASASSFRAGVWREPSPSPELPIKHVPMELPNWRELADKEVEKWDGCIRN